MTPHRTHSPQETLEMCLQLEHPWVTNDDLIACIRWMNLTKNTDAPPLAIAMTYCPHGTPHRYPCDECDEVFREIDRGSKAML